MSSPFNVVDGAADSHLNRVTLVNGRTFLVGAPDGSLSHASDGIVFEDLRIISEFAISVSHLPPGVVIPTELLAVSTPAPFHAVTVSRPDPEWIEGMDELYVHRQWIGRGVRHDIEIHNTGATAIQRTVAIHLDTDFAHVFDMKAGRHGRATTRFSWAGAMGCLEDVDDADRAVEVRSEPTPDHTDIRRKRLEWVIDCPAHTQMTVSVSFEPWWDRRPAGIAFPIGSPPSQAWPTKRLESWRRDAPSVRTNDPRLSVAVESSIADLASLRIFDAHHTERVVVAAGAPWFMTLFGRDSLLTAWMTVPFLPDLALGTIDTLADLQGSVERPDTEEQPGKILHELRRHGGDAAFANRGRYYGTVDATPLFLMVVGEAVRWGHLDDDGLRRRWGAVDAAVGWIRRGIARGDGLLRYRRSTEVGLLNQGWKDSWDGISFADGGLPSGAVALAEVQGYAHAALLAAAALAERCEVADLDPAVLRREARDLAERFEAAFWVEQHSSYAVGLDGDDRPIDAVTTNPGHAIWTGIADIDRSHRYLDRIMDDDLFSGWGLRTLSPSCARYDPLSYHNGSVWPHDTALVAAGAARLGRHDVVDRLRDAALDVAGHADGRPPELFAGVDRQVIDVPVPYPSSCSPQAWASASTLLHLRSALSLEPPDAPDRPPTLHASGPAALSALTGIRVGELRYVARRTADGWECTVANADSA